MLAMPNYSLKRTGRRLTPALTSNENANVHARQFR